MTLDENSDIYLDHTSEQLSRVLATLRILKRESLGIEIAELSRFFAETGATDRDIDQAFSVMRHMKWASTANGRATITKTGKKFVDKINRFQALSRQNHELN